MLLLCELVGGGVIVRWWTVRYLLHPKLIQTDCGKCRRNLDCATSLLLYFAAFTMNACACLSYFAVWSIICLKFISLIASQSTFYGFQLLPVVFWSHFCSEHTWNTQTWCIFHQSPIPKSTQSLAISLRLVVHVPMVWKSVCDMTCWQQTLAL